MIASLGAPNRWHVLQDSGLKQWDKIEIHDHLHVFLLDHFQHALSFPPCEDVAGRLPLIEMFTTAGCCASFRRHRRTISENRLSTAFSASFLMDSVFDHNRLACEFVGGAASWLSCRDVMKPKGSWRPFVNLFALPRSFAHVHSREIDGTVPGRRHGNVLGVFRCRGCGSYGEAGARLSRGDTAGLDMEPAHALAFLAIVLNPRRRQP